MRGLFIYKIQVCLDDFERIVRIDDSAHYRCLPIIELVPNKKLKDTIKLGFDFAVSFL